MCLPCCFLANSSSLISSHSCCNTRTNTQTHFLPTVLPVSLSHCLPQFTWADLKHDHTSQLPWESLSYTDSQAAPHRDWIDRLGWSQDISTLSKQSWRLWNQNILTPGEVQWDQRRLGCCPTRMRPRPCAFFPPALLPRRGLPGENWRYSAQHTGTRRHKQWSCAAMATLRPTANSNTSWKPSAFVHYFFEKLFELYSEIKVRTCSKFMKTLEWPIFLRMGFSS